MSLTAVLLITASAVLHATWNLIGKRQHPTAAFFLLANTIGAVALLPVPLLFWREILLVPAPVWLCLLLAGFCNSVYYTALAGAYRTGDLSVAYPLVRSFPVILITLFMLLGGRGHELGPLYLVGAALVTVGCFGLPVKRFCDLSLQNYLNLSCLLALVGALGTTVYTIVDDAALARLRALDDFGHVTAPLVYIFLEACSASCWMSLLVFCSRKERRHLFQLARTARGPAALMGIGIYLCYVLVLAAMAFVDNVGYVAAFRQLSLPIGVLYGILLLDEPRYLPRLIGALILFSGLVLVGLG